MVSEVTKKAIPTLFGSLKGIPRIDSSLTMEGCCADAKAVGDRLREATKAINFSYDGKGNGLNATTIQEALDELKSNADSLTDNVDGLEENLANIFNVKRPTGTYTGNGSAEARTINVGGTGGWLGVCSGSYMIGIITQNGAMFFNTTNSTVKCFPVSQAKYMSGVLTISSADDFLNKKDSAYHYQVL